MDQIVGHYKILGQVGEGSMGAVFLAMDLMLDREVALKSLRPELARQKETSQRFREEARVLARLNHPNILQLYSFFEHESDLFMVMEYVRGVTMDELIRQKGRLPFAEALPLFLQMLEGVEYAHRMGIVHRDLKPANIMIAENGVPKLTDFGVARVLGAARMTRPGTMVGTLEYMSPERVLSRELDARSDLYSMGFVFYEMLNGSPPFLSDVEYELMLAQTEKTPPRIDEKADGIPREVADAVFRTMAKKPGDRFESVAQFAAILRKYTDGAPVSVEKDARSGFSKEELAAVATASARELRTGSPRLRLYLAGVVGVAALVAVGLAILAPHGSAPNPAKPSPANTASSALNGSTEPASSPAQTDSPAEPKRVADVAPAAPPKVTAPGRADSTPPRVATPVLGTLSGSVVDTNQRAISGARVSIGSAGGTELAATSSREGKFFFPSCQPGVYELTVEAAGYRTYTLRRVKVDPRSEITLAPIPLEPAQNTGTEDR